MQKAMYPSPYIRITQKDHTGTHADSWAFDEAGSDSGIDYVIAPFDAVVKKIYTSDANEVWLESLEPVLYADGTKDYMTIMSAHDNNVSNLKVGQVIKQGQRYYEEGTKGNASGNHIHFEVARGKFTGTGWHKNSAGYWSINNGKKVDECLLIDDSYHLLNTAGYHFKNVKDAEPKKFGTPVARNESINQLKIKESNVRARSGPNGQTLGYMNPGIYNSLEFKTIDGYDWHRVEDNLWFANGTWSDWLPKKEIVEEIPVPPVNEEQKPDSAEELQKTIEKLQSELDHKKKEIADLNEVIIELKISMPTLVFECAKEDYYAIKLKENQKLYLK